MKTETIVVLALVAAMIVLMLAAGGVGIWMMSAQAPVPTMVTSGTTTVTTTAQKAPPPIETPAPPVVATPADALFMTAQQRLEARDWEGVRRAVAKTAELGDVAHVQRLYNLLGQNRQWEQTVPAVRKAIELNEQGHWHWYMLGVAAMADGDGVTYVQACEGMLERFGDRPDPDDEPMIAERIAKMALLKPELLDEATVRRAYELADHAVDVGRQTRSTLTPWFEMTAALADYRRGDHEAALTHLDAARQGQPYYLHVGTHCLRAMALHKLDRMDEAKAALAQADSLLEQVVSPDGAGPISAGWNDWVMSWQLREEARRLIEEAEGDN